MLTTAAIFSNEMVLQREKRIALWGMADAGKEIKAQILDSVVKTDADEEGKWYLELPPMTAGGPYTLTITSGEEKLEYADVMIGEVWFAGGQSNMELELQNSLNGQEVISKIGESKVRYYHVPHIGFLGEELEKAEAENTWKSCSSQMGDGCSAVGYYFAKEVSEKLGIAVGIINCSWGGTSASCWVDEPTLMHKNDTRIYMDEYNQAMEGKTFEEYKKEKEEYDIYYEEWNKKIEEYYATHEEPSWDEACSIAGENRWPGPVGPLNEYRPTGLYHAMIQRVCPYTVRGFLYYQGEQDEGKPQIYYSLLSSLVQKWRDDWKDDSLPFLCVQLPMFKNKGDFDRKNWPLIREAQMRVYQTIKNTGIAVILDSGEFNNIHPLDKETVGHRLALQAFANVYDVETDAFGPLYTSYTIDGQKMVLQFSHGEQMEYHKDDAPGIEPEQSETGFEIAGKDKKYVPAKIEVEGSKVIVSSDEVEEPRYVRYAWTNYGPVTMYGKNGIPMAPFRTSKEDGSEDEAVC